LNIDIDAWRIDGDIKSIELEVLSLVDDSQKFMHEPKTLAADVQCITDYAKRLIFNIQKVPR
jgi:hypothetical protein